jgi:uncharacterized Ntn-hydrolase superfamily protein
VTFSIIARDPHSASFGVAVCTAVPCVGALVPHAMSGVGAVATQSYVNADLGRDGIRLLALGMSPKSALKAMLADDPGAHLRQVAAIDAQGRTFAYSGRDCVGWFGSREGENYSVQGNMLIGPEVVDAMAAVFEDMSHAWLSMRLLGALEAGQAVGGDKRGRQSAALLVTPSVVVKGAPLEFDLKHCELNVRVDEHPEPVQELRRIFDVLLREGEREHDEAEAAQPEWQERD